MGGTASAVFPGEEELTVAFGKAGAGVDGELYEHAVDPAGGAFELGPGADGCFVDDEVGCGAGFGKGEAPFGAELLVDEGGRVAEVGEYGGEGVAVADGRLGFDAGLISGVVGVFRGALVGEGAAAAVAAEAEKLMAAAELAVWGVEEGVVLEGAWGFEMKAEVGEAFLELCGVGDGEFELDLSAGHGCEYTGTRAVQQ